MRDPIYSNLDDWIGLLLWSLVLIPPSIYLIWVTFQGEGSWALVIGYVIPSIICFFAVAPWKEMKPTTRELNDYAIGGKIPDSSRMGRRCFAFLPLLNLFVSYAIIHSLYQKIISKF